jgi:hypothetical protein
MSPLTRWLALSAVAIVALLACNALMYRHRHGTFVPAARAKPSYLKQRIKGSELGIMCLFVLSLLAGLGAPKVAPESSFAQWLLSPYASVVYYACCFLGPVVATVLARVYTLLAAKR